jgi:hypothetical protein
MPDKNVDGTLLTWHFDDGREVPVNRFQLMSRLGQTYVVGNIKYEFIALSIIFNDILDQISRAIDYRLLWHKNININYYKHLILLSKNQMMTKLMMTV